MYVIKVIALQYQYDFPKSFETYQKKISHLVKHHANEGAKLLLFPEYAGLEMLSFVSMDKLQEFLPAYMELF